MSNIVNVNAYRVEDRVRYEALVHGAAKGARQGCTHFDRKASPFVAVNLNMDGEPSILGIGKKEYLESTYRGDAVHVVPVAFDPASWPMRRPSGIVVGRVLDEKTYWRDEKRQRTISHRDMLSVSKDMGLPISLRRGHNWAVVSKEAGTWAVRATEETWKEAEPWGRLYGIAPVPIMRFESFEDMSNYIDWRLG